MKIIGIGAAGHAKVMLDILRRTPGLDIVGLLDPSEKLRGQSIEGTPVLGGDDLLPGLLRDGVTHAFLGVGGIGDNHRRAQVFDRVRALGFRFVAAIHPSAVVAASVRVGEGVAIMAGCIVNPATSLGVNVILNTAAVVDHDCVLDDHVHIAPGAVLSGGVRVGKYSHVGVGATVRQGIEIGENVLVGAGAVVVHDVEPGEMVVGIPARPRNLPK